MNAMGWLLKRLGGAIVAGVGWKLGADTYEAVKKRVKELRGDAPDESSSEEGDADEGGAATSRRPGALGREG
jgi:hypothetical protein